MSTVTSSDIAPALSTIIDKRSVAQARGSKVPKPKKKPKHKKRK